MSLDEDAALTTLVLGIEIYVAFVHPCTDSGRALGMMASTLCICSVAY